MTIDLIDSRDIRRANPVLGSDLRTFKATCARFGIQVRHLNQRRLVLTRHDYDLLLQRVSGKDEAA